MFTNKRRTSGQPASDYHGSLNIGKTVSRDKSRVFITIEVENDGLAEKILENIRRNISINRCKNCGKRMIVNSATHEICWRCRDKDRHQGSGNVEL